MSRGVCLLAAGNPVYGYFAYNMACSIRRHNPSLPITVLCDQKGIAYVVNRLPKIADILLIDTSKYRTPTAFEAGLMKLDMHKSFPYTETIYLDADGLCIGDLSWIFEEAKGRYFATDFSNRQDWITKKSLESFKLESMPGIQSSFQYVRKGKESKAIFKKALDLTKDEKVEQNWSWGKSTAKPDELYLALALTLMKEEMFLSKTVVYFRMVTTRNSNGGMTPDRLSEIREQYSAFGLFGNQTTNNKQLVSWYDVLSRENQLAVTGEFFPLKAETLMRSKLANG